MLFKSFPLKLPRPLIRKSIFSITFLCMIFMLSYRPDFRLYQTELKEPIVYSNQPVSTVKGLPIILLWNDFFGDPTWNGVAETILPCGCLITNDRSLLPQSSIVIFNWRAFDANDVPTKYGNQIWVWHHLESPVNTWRRTLLEQFQKHIDCWATYRQDSDFVLDYGRFEKLIKPRERSLVKISSKPKYIAWMVSNCGAKSGRDQLAYQLSKYIPVDIYGKCGSYKCPYSKDKDCWKMIAANYKFYLSFENSICHDYFTEKVIKPLEEDIIPIVLGGADYDKILPNKSFIDARKFDTPKSLAMFLLSLAIDEERYNSYFQWKTNYTAIQRIPTLYNDVMCDICSSIEDTTFSKTCRGQKENLVDWWFNNSICQDFMY